MSKVRKGGVSFDKEQLVADVRQAWHDYSLDTLKDMWEYHRYCQQAAIKFKGGNNYPRHPGGCTSGLACGHV